MVFQMVLISATPLLMARGSISRGMSAPLPDANRGCSDILRV